MGWRVEPVSLEDVEAYLEVRKAMELTALEAAQPNIQRSEVLALLDGENHALDDALHRFLIEKSGNRYIIAFFNQFVSRFYRKLLYYAAPEAKVVDEMTSEHIQILRAILDTNWSSAREILSRHILGQKSVLERILIAGQRDRRR
jgi:DNA-binding GntR family transcriptional regulator